MPRLKYSVFCCLLFFSLPRTLVAQEPFFNNYEQNRDKAIAELKRYPNPDTARVNALARVTSLALFLKQRKELYPYCQEGMAISRRLGYAKGMAQCYMFVGLYNKSSLNSAAAHTYFDSVIITAGNSSEKKLLELKAQANEMKGRLYYDHENYYAALSHFFESMKYNGNIPGLNLSIHLYL